MSHVQECDTCDGSNPLQQIRIMECDACRAKPGAPVLCEVCLHNEKAVSRLQDALRATFHLLDAVVLEEESVMLAVIVAGVKAKVGYGR